MPILNKEPSLHPEWLLEPEYEATVGDGGDQDSPRRWWAVYTRPRQEKVLARIFWENGSHFYLPLVPRKGVYQRRTVVSHLPLFEGYVFLFGSEEQRVAALATNRVYHIVGVNEPLQFVRDLRRKRAELWHVLSAKLSQADSILRCMRVRRESWRDRAGICRGSLS